MRPNPSLKFTNDLHLFFLQTWFGNQKPKTLSTHKCQWSQWKAAWIYLYDVMLATAKVGWSIHCRRRSHTSIGRGETAHTKADFSWGGQPKKRIIIWSNRGHHQWPTLEAVTAFARAAKTFSSAFNTLWPLCIWVYQLSISLSSAQRLPQRLQKVTDGEVVLWYVRKVQPPIWPLQILSVLNWKRPHQRSNWVHLMHYFCSSPEEASHRKISSELGSGTQIILM